MKLFLFRLRHFAPLVVLASFTGSLFGQHVVFTEHNNGRHIVRQVSRNRLLIEEDGERISLPIRRIGLHKVEEYLPVFVAIHDPRASTSAITSEGASFNNNFSFSAHFESAYPLKHVFLVLDLKFENGQHHYFIREVGDLQPYRRQHVKVTVEMTREFGEGVYHLHLFADGMELLHSMQPPEFRETILDTMVASRVKERTDGPPTPFVAPPPQYPSKLAKTKKTGAVRVRATIYSNGTVSDPTILSATDPAFGETALNAVRLWRFLPKIEQGRPVETVAILPIEFIPPK